MSDVETNASGSSGDPTRIERMVTRAENVRREHSNLMREMVTHSQNAERAHAGLPLLPMPDEIAVSDETEWPITDVDISAFVPMYVEQRPGGGLLVLRTPEAAMTRTCPAPGCPGKHSVASKGQNLALSNSDVSAVLTGGVLGEWACSDAQTRVRVTDAGRRVYRSWFGSVEEPDARRHVYTRYEIEDETFVGTVELCPGCLGKHEYAWPESELALDTETQVELVCLNGSGQTFTTTIMARAEDKRDAERWQYQEQTSLGLLAQDEYIEDVWKNNPILKSLRKMLKDDSLDEDTRDFLRDRLAYLRGRMMASAEALPDPRVRAMTQAVETERWTIREQARTEEAERKEAEKVALLPPVRSLRESIDDPAAEDVDRIASICGVGERMILVALQKVGKTTMKANLIRSLLTGEPLLGKYAVNVTMQKVFVLNYEMSENRWKKWAVAHGLGEEGLAERIDVWHLRGHGNPLASEKGREEFAARLAVSQPDGVLIDTFSRAFHGDNANDNSQAKDWTDMVDELVGPNRDLVVTVHAGWADHGRSRGASHMQDWPDTILNIREHRGVRYLTGAGRVDGVDEISGVPLDFDPETKTLRVLGGGKTLSEAEKSSKDEAREAKELTRVMQWTGSRAALLRIVGDWDVENLGAPGIRDLRMAVRAPDSGFHGRNDDVDTHVQECVTTRLLAVEPGPRNKVLHSLTDEGREWLEEHS